MLDEVLMCTQNDGCLLGCVLRGYFLLERASTSCSGGGAGAVWVDGIMNAEGHVHVLRSSVAREWYLRNHMFPSSYSFGQLWQGNSSSENAEVEGFRMQVKCTRAWIVRQDLMWRRL